MARRLIVASLFLALALGPAVTLAAQEQPPATGTFEAAGSLSVGRANHSATRLLDGRVLAVGGFGKEGDSGVVTLASAEIWDPATATFGGGRSLEEARDLHTATLLSDGRVLVIGGTGATFQPLSSAEVWEPSAASFAPGGTLKTARRGHTATALPDGRILVIGGRGTDGLLASAEIWDPVTEAFGPTGSLAQARDLHSATLLPDGRVLVIGGTGSEGALASSEIWDPARSAFIAAASLPEPRRDHTATRLSDGRVLLVGGNSGAVAADGSVAADSALFWEPAAEIFEATASLQDGRFGHTATYLSEDHVLIVGGLGDASLPPAEVWQPSTESFAPAGILATPRFDAHTTTPLLDGRVLVIGGLDQALVPVSSAEIYVDVDA